MLPKTPLPLPPPRGPPPAALAALAAGRSGVANTQSLLELTPLLPGVWFNPESTDLDGDRGLPAAERTETGVGISYRSTAGSHRLRWLEDINRLRVMVKA
jgi:hypothetical protein